MITIRLVAILFEVEIVYTTNYVTDIIISYILKYKIFCNNYCIFQYPITFMFNTLAHLNIEPTHINIPFKH